MKLLWALSVVSYQLSELAVILKAEGIERH